MSDWLENLSIPVEQKAKVLEKGFDSFDKLFEAATAEKKQTSWLDNLSSEEKGFLEVKGFDHPSKLVRGYENLERLKGVPADRLIKVPEKADDVDGWKEVYAKLGRPEKPEDYGYEAPEGQEVDKETLKWAREQIHELGLTKAQGEKFLQKWNELGLEKAERAQQAYNEEKYESEKELKIKWGAKYEKNLHDSINVAQRFGLKMDEIETMQSSLGRTRTMEVLAKLAEAVGEAKHFDGKDGKEGLLSPDAAKYQLKGLYSDTDFQAKLQKGDPSAVERVNRLVNMANGVAPTGL